MAVASQETLQTTKTIDVMVATTSPLMQDSRELPSSGSTYRYDVVRTSMQRHVLNT